MILFPFAFNFGSIFARRSFYRNRIVNIVLAGGRMEEGFLFTLKCYCFLLFLFLNLATNSQIVKECELFRLICGSWKNG
jgi:hypothetical protein